MKARYDERMYINVTPICLYTVALNVITNDAEKAICKGDRIRGYVLLLYLFL